MTTSTNERQRKGLFVDTDRCEHVDGASGRCPEPLKYRSMVVRWRGKRLCIRHWREALGG